MTKKFNIKKIKINEIISSLSFLLSEGSYITIRDNYFILKNFNKVIPISDYNIINTTKINDRHIFYVRSETEQEPYDNYLKIHYMFEK